MLIRYGVVLPLVWLAGFALANETAVVEGGTGVSAIEGKAYESVDAQGNVEFSDEKPNGVPSKVIGIPETNTYVDPDNAGAAIDSGAAVTGTTTADAAANNEEQADGQGAVDGAAYSSFAIVNPAVDGPFNYGVDGLRFDVVTRPPLRGGHRIQYLIDGKVIGVPSSDPYLQANNLVEGDHRIEARIVDMSGTVLQSTVAAGFNLNRAADGRCV